MQARQAEFDAYDSHHKASASGGGAASGAWAQAEGNSQDPKKLEQNVAALGREISGLLERASCLDGLEVAQGSVTNKAATTMAASRTAGGNESDSGDSGSEL